MVSYKRTKMVVLICLVNFLCIQKSVADTLQKLTFMDAIDLANTQNLTLKQSAQETALHQADVLQSRVASYPNLNISVTPTQNLNREQSQTGSVVYQHSSSLQAVASSHMTLFDGGANHATYQAATKDLNASEASLKNMHQQVMYLTASQFLQVCKNAELIRVTQENLVAQREQLQLIDAFWQQGVRSKADFLQQQAFVAKAELDVLKAERNWQISQLHLKKTLNLPTTNILEVVPPNDILNNTNLTLKNNSISTAQTTRADILAQQHQTTAADWRIREAKSGYLPTLSLSGNVGTDYSSLNNISGFRDQAFNINPSINVGLTLTFPIFDRSQTQSKVERARVQLAQQELALRQVKQTVAFEVEQAVVDFQSAKKQHQVSTTTEAAAREALQAMEARYEMGVATLAELSQVRASFVDATSGLVEARYDVVIQYLNAALKLGQIDRVIANLKSN